LVLLAKSYLSLKTFEGNFAAIDSDCGGSVLGGGTGFALVLTAGAMGYGECLRRSRLTAVFLPEASLEQECPTQRAA
jgi:hypothetical protein